MNGIKHGVKPLLKIVLLLTCVALVPHVFVYFTASPSHIQKKNLAQAYAHKGYNFLKVLSHLKRLDTHEDIEKLYEYIATPESLSALEYQWIQLCAMLAQRDNGVKNISLDPVLRAFLVHMQHNVI